MEPFICPRCGNDNPVFVGWKDGTPYCRKCISFNGTDAQYFLGSPQNVRLCLNYNLSKKQKALSDQVLANYKAGIDTLIYAVCGSGKTEISYGVIAYAMSRGERVGFALPRRDVVIELRERLAASFPGQKVVSVLGGHTDVLEGDLIILTTHQLYRYENYFDLLVMDEVDAFPYKGNEVLTSFCRRSVRGHSLMMSATPSKALVTEYRQKGKAMLTLHTRFHNKPIPVPQIKVVYGYLKIPVLANLLRKFKKEGKPCFVFVPTIEKTETLFKILNPFVKGGNFVSSKRKAREEIIADFKKGKYGFLITTAVLERGITVSNLQVVVYESDNSIYDAAALIQISGRAGRKYNAPKGEVVFLANKITREMEKAVEEIKYCNTFL